MSRAERGLARSALWRQFHKTRAELLALTRRLVAIPSENPPGDTRALVAVIAETLQSIDGVEIECPSAVPPIANLVARITGREPGRRLIFNGHLDTYPIGDRAQWSVDPLVGAVQDDRLYGRGVSDMKGGIACSMWAFMMMAQRRDDWSGELVLTLAGDEESMGSHGTQFLLETVPHAAGDAMICGDAGSPLIGRFGEKGMIWLELSAAGRAAHGAHVHLGDNAIENLLVGMTELCKLRGEPVTTPPNVADRIARAKAGVGTDIGPGRDLCPSVGYRELWRHLRRISTESRRGQGGGDRRY